MLKPGSCFLHWDFRGTSVWSVESCTFQDVCQREPYQNWWCQPKYGKWRGKKVPVCCFNSGKKQAWEGLGFCCLEVKVSVEEKYSSSETLRTVIQSCRLPHKMLKTALQVQCNMYHILTGHLCVQLGCALYKSFTASVWWLRTRVESIDPGPAW